MRTRSPVARASLARASRAPFADSTSPTAQHSSRSTFKVQSSEFPVIFRTIPFGSQSLRGAQALATNLSLITTAKRHGRDPLELIKTVLLKAGDTPLDALYDPDCLSKNDSS